jgi:hypothetical protein
MSLAHLFFVVYGWLVQAALVLLAVAAILTAVKTRTLHSILFSVAVVLIWLSGFLHYLATPPLKLVRQGVFEIRYQYPLEGITTVRL